MAGTVTQSSTYNPARPQQAINRIVLAWTSDASGNVSGTPSTVITGTILKVTFIPSESVAPTANYDVTLLDDAGIDVLAGQGANLSATAETSVCPGVPLRDGTTTSVVPCVVSEALNLVVANAGNAKSGQVVLFVR